MDEFYLNQPNHTWRCLIFSDISFFNYKTKQCWNMIFVNEMYSQRVCFRSYSWSRKACLCCDCVPLWGAGVWILNLDSTIKRYRCLPTVMSLKCANANLRIPCIWLPRALLQSWSKLFQPITHNAFMPMPLKYWKCCKIENTRTRWVRKYISIESGRGRSNSHLQAIK